MGKKKRRKESENNVLVAILGLLTAVISLLTAMIQLLTLD